MDLVKELSLTFILTWTAEQCNGLEECCYSYASVPRNDTFCVPEGEQVHLDCVIVNPHDNFTNLTVAWFRGATEDMSIFDEIPATSEEYRYINFNAARADNALSVINCSRELYYRDLFSLIIPRFTRNKNGYYWCQLSINNTLAQPSHRAQFFIGDCNIIDYHSNYYRLANSSERKCAQYVATEADAGLTTIYVLSRTSSSSRESSTRLSSVTQQGRERNKTVINVATESGAESSTRLSSDTQPERESNQSIIYVAGSFSALLLIALLGVLVLALSFACYVHHQRKKTKHQRGATSELETQEYDDICTGRATTIKEESHVYQTLKLNEMNYESMYAKIMPKISTK